MPPLELRPRDLQRLYASLESPSLKLHWIAQALDPSLTYEAWIQNDWVTEEGGSFQRAVQEIQNGLPLDYATGLSFFRGKSFQVNKDVLIPRLETEELVEWMLEEPCPGQGAEVGFGSGVIGISLLEVWKACCLSATEAHPGALKLGKKQIERFGLAPRLTLLEARQGEVLEPFERAGYAYDWLVSNPPYLCPEDMTPAVAQHEPMMALIPPEEPLYFYKKLALAPCSVLYLEINHEWANQMRELFSAKGWQVSMREDGFGKCRFLKALRGKR